MPKKIILESMTDLSAVDVRKQCYNLRFLPSGQDDEMKNAIAHDLNRILNRFTRIMMQQDTNNKDDTEYDFKVANAALRLVKRVAEFEGIAAID